MKESHRAAVRDYELHILATEGPYHVEGRYWANEYHAERQRHFAAVRMVMESQHRATFRGERRLLPGSVYAVVASRARGHSGNTPGPRPAASPSVDRTRSARYLDIRQ